MGQCGFPKLGVPFCLFGGPYNKDYSILGCMLGSPCFGKLQHRGLGNIEFRELG